MSLPGAEADSWRPQSKLDREVTRWLLTQGATAIRRETAAQHMTHSPVLAGHCEKYVGWQ